MVDETAVAVHNSAEEDQLEAEDSTGLAIEMHDRHSSVHQAEADIAVVHSRAAVDCSLLTNQYHLS